MTDAPELLPEQYLCVHCGHVVWGGDHVCPGGAAKRAALSASPEVQAMTSDWLAVRGSERTPPETIAFAAWVNCKPDAIPPEYRQHTCEATMTAWRRVVAALMGPAALAASPEVAKLIREAEANNRALMMDALAALVSARDTIRRKWATTNPERERVISALSDALGVEIVPAAIEAAALRGKGE